MRAMKVAPRLLVALEFAGFALLGAVPAIAACSGPTAAVLNKKWEESEGTYWPKIKITVQSVGGTPPVATLKIKATKGTAGSSSSTTVSAGGSTATTDANGNATITVPVTGPYSGTVTHTVVDGGASVTPPVKTIDFWDDFE